jgi:hypothetical protein
MILKLSSEAILSERNEKRCYIPEWLLEEWKIPVDERWIARPDHKGPSARRQLI